MSDPDFRWYRDPDVVVKEQAAIAVFRNAHGHVVIRKKGDLDPETYEFQDAWITVAPRHAVDLARAILALAEPQQAQQLVMPAPMTPAERQRKRRDKQRDSVTTQRDTERDRRDSATDLFEETPAKVVEAGQ